MRKIYLIILFVLIVVLISCNTKYSLHFYKFEGQQRFDLQNEGSYFRDGYVIARNNPGGIISPGLGTVLVTNQSMVDPEMKDIPSGLLTTSGKINYRIYTDLPADLKKDSLSIGGKSICQIIGQYNRPESLKIYNCTEGYIRLDSVKSSKFFAVLSGKYVNLQNDSLVFWGEMKPKKRK
jgi:hypothetical protein